MRNRIQQLVKFALVPVALIVGGFYWMLMQDFPKINSLLIHNGTVVTMEPGESAIEAVFVRDGLIVGLGSLDAMSALKDADTKILDLQGKTLLPGFIDSHTHPVLSMFTYGMLDLSGFTHNSNSDVWQHFRNELKNYEPGEWVICKGLDPVLVEDLETPKIDFLDSVAPDNPVLIVSQSLHSYWANTLAFEAAGIDASTPNPSASSFYEKDSDGNLTGYFAEQDAFSPFKEVVQDAIGEQTLVQHCVSVLDDYAKNGHTSITALGLATDDPNLIRLYDHLSSGQPTFVNQLLSLFNFLPARKPTVRHFAFIRFDSPELLPESTDNGDDFFKIVGIKFWYDGAPYAGTMYIEDPYLDTDFNHDKLHIGCKHTGEALISQAEIDDYIDTYQSAGWQIAIHAQGDTAIQEIVDAFDRSKSAKEHRHRLEHCLLAQKSTIQQMRKLNIHPSFHINHLYYYGKALRDEIIGSDRTDDMLPIQWAEENDLVYSLHADQPMFPSEPFSLLHTAVNRKTKEGIEIGAHHAISVEQGLKALTINAAWQIKMEEKIGSIKVGKYADFVVVDKNPLLIAKEELRNIKVLQTIVNGQTVYSVTAESPLAIRLED